MGVGLMIKDRLFNDNCTIVGKADEAIASG
jgi:hypothetical protein